MKYDVITINKKDILRDTSWNCRGPIAPGDVVGLAKDIETHGLDTPVTVMPWNLGGHKYKLVCGFSRAEAIFTILKRDEIPCFVRTDLDDISARIQNLRENLQRKDLNILQEAKAIVPLRHQGKSDKEIAREFDKSMTWVKARLDLLTLPEDIQAVAATGIFTNEMIKKMASSTREQQYAIVHQIKNKQLDLNALREPKIPKRKFHKSYKIPPERQIILTVLEKIYDITNADLTTRALAWCAGEISYDDFKKDLLIDLDRRNFDPRRYQDDF